MDIRHQIRKTIAYKTFNKANKVGKESNPLSGNVSTYDPYLISGTLCDFWSLCTFRNHVVSDFWVYTFRFLDMCNNIVTIF